MSKKPETLTEIFDGYRSVATDSIKMLKTVPYTDVAMLNKVDELFNALADCDIALQAHIRKQVLDEMAQIASAPGFIETEKTDEQNK